MSYNDYSDEEYSDDEYAPLELTSWGAQAVTGENGKTEVNVSMDGWQSLIDPSVKLKAGGVGSGQLHRKGGNFKPLDESYIIQQRLGKPIPKAIGGGKKKKSGKPKGSAAPPPSRKPLVPPSSSAYRAPRRPITAPGNNVWGAAELASTPFWEQSASSATSGTFASKYASPAPAAAPVQPQQRQPPPPSQEHSWGALDERAPAKPPVQQQQQQQQPQAPSAFTHSATGSRASKYATPAASAPVQQPPQPPQQYQQPPPPQQQQQLPPQQVYAPSSTPTIYHKLEQPVLTINIEISQGITAKMLVYENDEPYDAVEQFEKNHHLTMDVTAKQRFAQQVHLLLQEYKSRQ